MPHVPHVPVITLSDAADTHFVQRYIERQLRTAETTQLYAQATDWPWPAVFRGTAVTRWTALRTWSAARLSSVLKDAVLRDVYRNSNPVFGPYYDAARPMSHVPGITRANPHQLLDLAAPDLFAKLAAPDNETYYYYSENIERVAALLEDVLPFEALLQLDARGTEQNVNVWFGMAGVTAANHYDGYDNLYAQIRGSKQWLLVPPSAAAGMALYPFLHPHHAQSRVDTRALLAADPALRAREWPRALNVTPLVVELLPGDVLYLPAMWFHRVEARGLSLSVNVWTRTHESALMKQIAEQLPFTNEQPRDQKLDAAIHYLRALLRAHKVSERRDFADLYHERYEPLVRAGELRLTHVQCTDAPSATAQILAKSHARIFDEMGEHTRRIWRHNHVEYVLFNALEQDVLPVASVLHCLARQ